MQNDAAVIKALQAVVDGGMDKHAVEFAKSALAALQDNDEQEGELKNTSDATIEQQLHVMLSCEYALAVWLVCRCDRNACFQLSFAASLTDQWDAQSTVIRANESLIERGYVTWFDLTHMKGKYLSCFLLLVVCSASAIANMVCARVYIVHCTTFFQEAQWTR